MARMTPVALTGVLLLCLDVAVLNLKASGGGSALVARRGLGVRGGEQSPDPPIITHAVGTLSVGASLFF